MSSPVISQNDKRQYKYLELSNKMSCLLISDSNADKSAASVTVHVGSLQDTQGRPGIAHFLEHMLFMGTEKFPDQNDYGNFITSNSGSNNAYTSYLDTNYYFDIANEKFEGGLDRFAQFFVSPLFTENCTDKELNAVDSEHKKNIMSDGWRKFQLLKSTSKEGHIYNSFSTGNLDTLKHPSIREDLLDFYKKYYSSNLMKLAVYGKESLETLEQWVVKMFSDAKNFDTKIPEIKEFPFDKENMCQFYKLVPIEDNDYLTLEWYIENVRPYYKDQPTHYITTLIGHEGKNSLLSFLKDEGLALELEASDYIHANLFTEISINIKLTKKGLAEHDKVTRIVFQYLKVLRDHGVSKEHWEEFKQVLKMKFAFKDKEKPMGYVNQLSVRMHYVPTEDVVQEKFLMEEFKPELLKKIIDSLNPDNLRIYLSSKSVEKDCTKKEKWYGTQYIDAPLSDEILKYFSDPEIEKSTHGYILDLPPLNSFVPKSFDILAKDLSALPAYPSKVYSSNSVELFFKQDNIFKQPKACAKFQLYSTDHGFGTRLEATLLLQVWKKLWEESIRELKYEAYTAAFNVSVEENTGGIQLTLSGFSDSLNNVASAVFEKIESFDPKQYESFFEDIKDDLIKENENNKLKSPYQQAFNFSDAILETDPAKSHPDTIAKGLQKLTFKKLLDFHNDWLSTHRVEILIIGNLVEEQAVKIAKKVEEILASKKGSSALPADRIPESRIINLQHNTTWIFEEYLKPTKEGNKEPNSCCMCAFEYEKATPTTNMILEVLQNYLSEPVFETLRTNEQLGYIAFSYRFDNRGILTSNVLVQSSHKSPEYISSRIYNFFDSYRAKIKEITQEDFEKFVQSVRVNVEQKDLSIQEECNRYWKEVQRHSYLFNRKDLNLDELKKFKKEDLIELYKRLFLTKKRVVEIHVISEDHVEDNTKLKQERLAKEESTKEIVSIEWLKRRLPLYPDFHSML